MKTRQHMIPLFFFLYFAVPLQAQQIRPYENGFRELRKMLAGEKKLSFKEAVFLTENAWWNGNFPKQDYENKIELLKRIALGIQNISSTDAKNQVGITRSLQVHLSPLMPG